MHIAFFTYSRLYRGRKLREENIYHRLIRNEDSFSECLANLMQFDNFRDNLIKLLSSKLKLDIESLRFTYSDLETQAFYESKGIPDIQIKTQKSLILIESKVSLGTMLTQYQPDGYLNILNAAEEKFKILIFIVPKHYKYQHELRSKFENYLNNEVIIFDLFYWEDFINYFDGVTTDVENIAIRHFINFSKIWFPMQKIFFTTEELNLLQTNDLGGLMYKLMEIVDFIYNHPRRLRNIKVYKKVSDVEYGLYFENTDTGKNILYFGIWYEFWKQENFPFCLATKSEYDSMELFKKMFINHLEFHGWITVSFDVLNSKDGRVITADNISADIDALLIKLAT